MPKTKADPTGQAKNRRLAHKKLSNRLLKSKSLIKKLFKSIPKNRSFEKVIVNETVTLYEYEYNSYVLDNLNRDIKNILDDNLLETRNDSIQSDWYWIENIERSNRLGAAEEIVLFNQLVLSAIALGILVDGIPPRQLEVISYLRSNNYVEGLNQAILENFNDISGLSSDISNRLYREISSGIKAGKKPTDILASIDKRFEVADSFAKRIANTAINKAFNDAKMRASEFISKETGLSAGVIHISALLPTTRPHHASRHGKAFTVKAQTSWWDEGANRINCHCTVRSVLINSDGSVIDVEFQEKIKQEGQVFFGGQ